MDSNGNQKDGRKQRTKRKQEDSPRQSSMVKQAAEKLDPGEGYGL
jgi:hypothetical protein